MSFRSFAVLILSGCGAVCPIPGPVQPAPPDPHLHEQSKSVTNHALAPEVMLMLDLSSAMAPNLAELRAGIDEGLVTASNIMVPGLTEFPAAGQPTCASAAVDVIAPISNTVGYTHAQQLQRANDIQALIDSSSTRGDRNVVAAINSADFTNPDRDNYILLITSGDDECSDSLVDAIKAQRAKDTRTVVISFGPSAVWLDAAAQVGGFGASCPFGTDAECGPMNTCMGEVCDHASYVARDGVELADLFKVMTRTVGGDNVCTYTLETMPSRIERVQVFLNGDLSEPGPETWSLEAGKIIFTGAACDLLESSTTAFPVEVRVVVDDRP